MEEVPLDDVNQPALPPVFSIVRPLPTVDAEPPSPGWLKSYQNLMGETIRTVDVLLRAQDWSALPADENGSGIQLFTANYGGSYGYYSLKAHVTLEDVRAERLMHVIRDHDAETRAAWDKVTTATEVVEHLKLEDTTLRVVRSVVSSQMIAVWPRELLGIDWYGYNRNTRVHKYVFRTTQHRTTPRPSAPECISVIGFVGVVVRAVEKTRSELILVLNMNPGDKMPSLLVKQWFPELRTRIQLWARVAREWEQYYGPSRMRQGPK